MTMTGARATRRRDAMARRVTGDEATRREFHLARLLAACERRARGEGGDAIDARKRTQRLDALDAALASAREGLDDARAAAYAVRVSTVRSSGGGDVAVTSSERDGRDDDDDATTTTTTTTTTKAARDATRDATHAVARRVSAAQRTSVRDVRAPFVAGMEVRETDVDGPSTAPSTKSKSKTVTARDEIELRRQRAIQEGLTDEMSELASGLRANALALERGLGRSSAALAEVESRLERNVDGARASARRQTKVYRENRRGSCWTWIVLALVGVLFAWTYVVIKMSSVRVRR
jgi:SNARE protein 1